VSAPSPTAAANLTEAEVERYSRQLILRGVGAAGQRRLARATVLVVGAGALGSPVVSYLAAAGVGRLRIADGDVVDLSNLSRQVVHGEADLGRPKAVSAAAAVAGLNPAVAVETLGRLEGAALIAALDGVDLACDASDNFETKFALNDACVAAGVPLVHAAILELGGQLTTYVPDGPCYRCLFGAPPDPDAVPTCAEAGILGAVAGVVGAMQATEALKLILELGDPLRGRLLVYDGLRCRTREVRFPRDPACAAPHPAPAGG
jgi:adenylyltransferase/sulfurtransferase